MEDHARPAASATCHGRPCARRTTCQAASASPGGGAGTGLIGSTLLAAALVVGSTIPAGGQPTLGLTGGLTFSGDQDIRIVDPSIGSVESRDVSASAAIGPVAGVTGAYWLSHVGLQLDGLYWWTSAEAMLPGSAKKVHVDQNRGALLMSLIGRVFFAERGGPFAYGGVGGGFAVIGVDPGQTSVQPALGALAGVAIPVTPHLRIRAEVRYLLTHDMDPQTGAGISTEVSGNRGSNPGHAIFGPHFDTQFVPLLIGLDYVFR